MKASLSKSLSVFVPVYAHETHHVLADQNMPMSQSKHDERISKHIRDKGITVAATDVSKALGQPTA